MTARTGAGILELSSWGTAYLLPDRACVRFAQTLLFAVLSAT